MGPLDQLNHLLNFLAPALAVATVLALLGPFLGARNRSGTAIVRQLAVNFLVAGVALALGMWFFGRDGKMATYAAMLVCCTISQGITPRR